MYKNTLELLWFEREQDQGKALLEKQATRYEVLLCRKNKHKQESTGIIASTGGEMEEYR